MMKDYLKTRRAWVEQALAHTVETLTSESEILTKSMSYSLLAGGKRLRPILVLAAGEACSHEPIATLKGQLMPVACSLEMIHTYSLIHDDLPAMDNDDLRRGQPTNHKVFGEAVSILAGDALLTEAFKVMTQTPTGTITPAILMAVIQDIADAAGANGMAGGQQIDLEAEGKSLQLCDLEHLHHCKTGRLIEVSVTSGAKLAGASPQQVEALTQYGRSIGLAFQIVDDILDIEGATEDLGKPSGSDQAHDKSTYPALLGIEDSKKKAQLVIDQALKSLDGFAESATPLRELAQYIIQRQS
jgi:geranylgeranyl diphosphate synthase, type II